MKKITTARIAQIFWIIAFTALIAFTMTACGGDKSDLVGKWYASQEDADEGDSGIVAYEFTSDGHLKIIGISLMKYNVSGDTITTKILGFTTGTAKYSINGTELTISDGDPVTGLIDGTFYKNRNETKNKPVSEKDKKDEVAKSDKENVAKNDREPQDAGGGNLQSRFFQLLFGTGGEKKEVAEKNDKEVAEDDAAGAKTGFLGFLSGLFSKDKNDADKNDKDNIAENDKDDAAGAKTGFLSSLFGNDKNEPETKTGGKGTAPLINWMQNGTFSFDYEARTTAGGTTTMTGFMAVKDNDVSMTMKMPGVPEYKMILKNGLAYMVDDANKMVIVIQAQGPKDTGGMITDYSNMKYIGSGEGKIDGKTYRYEEYEELTMGSMVKYYLDGAQVYGIETKYEEFMMLMLISNPKNSVPGGIFNIPKGYTEINYR